MILVENGYFVALFSRQKFSATEDPPVEDLMRVKSVAHLWRVVLEAGMPAQVSSSSFDSGKKITKPVTNTLHVTSDNDVS
ncbi:hypothetical protein TNCV_493821 [Trichonephila clavipes]|nr:hypothetical protein TNCV_493821 [Trichonephila clavipes]